MSFIAELHQPHGCDYTIECGTRLVPLRASSIAGAMLELQAKLGWGPGGHDSDQYEVDGRELDRVRIYEVTREVSVDHEGWARDFNAQQDTQRQSDEERRERSELDRLKRKYET